jgi:hypothetical protein
MKSNSQTNHLYRSERGQSMVVVAASLAALLLLVVGVAFIAMAIFTSTAVQDPDQGGMLFGMIAPEDVSGVMEEAMPYPTATPSLGAIVGNQVYLVDPAGANTLAETGSQ